MLLTHSFHKDFLDTVDDEILQERARFYRSRPLHEPSHKDPGVNIPYLLYISLHASVFFQICLS